MKVGAVKRDLGGREDEWQVPRCCAGPGLRCEEQKEVRVGITVHREWGEWLETRLAEVRSGRRAVVRTLAFTLG